MSLQTARPSRPTIDIDFQFLDAPQQEPHQTRPQRARLWWYGSHSVESLQVDRALLDRLTPLLRSGFIAHNMSYWLRSAAEQYRQKNPTLNAPTGLSRKTQWIQLCGRTKSEVIHDILGELASRLERGEIQASGS